MIILRFAERSLSGMIIWACGLSKGCLQFGFAFSRNDNVYADAEVFRLRAWVVEYGGDPSTTLRYAQDDNVGRMGVPNC